jgi:DNA-binding FadR family transcriptional regulator
VKKAEILADQIEREIVDRGLEPGVLFGVETELIGRYQISRAIFREAVRLLEHHGVADMRRGLHGGLFIRQPHPEPVANAMAVYLDYQKVEPGQLEEARVALEAVCVERLAARINEADIARLRQFLDAEAEMVSKSMHDFHVLIAEMTGNPALHLFVHSLTDLTQRQRTVPLLDADYQDDIHVAHTKIAEAIIARDGSLARHRMITHLEAVASVWEQRNSPATTAAGLAG